MSIGKQTMRLQSLNKFPQERLNNIQYVLTDIDDTLTTGGRITARTYHALEQLYMAGIHVVPITGRPAGWCDHIARVWPVTAVVGENGAFYFYFDAAANKLARRDAVSADLYAKRQTELNHIASEVLERFPGCALASDQAYRIADIAIDFCEDVPKLSDAVVTEIVRYLVSKGLTVKVSSIHVNAWFGEYDKLTMTRQLFAEYFGLDLNSVNEQCVFVGDSPNDAPMFDYFTNSIGVANVRDFQDQLEVYPAYVSDSAYGDGFVDLADRVVSARGAKSHAVGV